jgi:DNA-binding MarR family transcriptional regulator
MSSIQEQKSILIEKLTSEFRKNSTRTILFHQTIADKLKLNATDYKCYDFINQTGAVTAGQLSKLTGLTTGSTTALIDRLENYGYIKRDNDPNDRRRVLIKPLHQIKENNNSVFASLSSAITELCSRYNEEELDLVLDFLTNMDSILLKETEKLQNTIVE